MIEGTDDPEDSPVVELQPLLRGGQRVAREDNPKMLLMRDPDSSVAVGVSANFPSLEANGDRNGRGRGHGNAVSPLSMETDEEEEFY